MTDPTISAGFPPILEAAGWGLLSAVGLLIGAVCGYSKSLKHSTIARTMTFAAGVLLAVVAVDLVTHARGVASAQRIVIGLLSGAGIFSFINWEISRRGAPHRKRCGECVEQPSEVDQPGSGLAIALGTFLDGVPEGAVLGASVLHLGAPDFSTVAAFFLANIPEALSSTAGMVRAGRSRRYIFAVWSAISAMIGLAATISYVMLRHSSAGVLAVVQAFAAGAILALVAETMIPEGFHGSPKFNGLLLVGGFVALLILLS